MEEKEIKALLKEQVEGPLGEAIKSQITEAAKGLITVDAFEKSLTEMGIEKETIKNLTDSIEAQGAKITEMLEKQTTPKEIKPIGKTIEEQFDNIKKHVGEGGGSFKFMLEKPYHANKTTIGLASITNDPMGMFIPGFAEIQTQQNRLAASLTPFQLTADDHGVIYWTDQTTRTNNAAARSDGSAAAEQVYLWTGYAETVDNVSAMIPVHKEALKHISVLQNEIQRLLSDDVLVALDGYCYTGTGTAPQIGGIYTRSTAFDAAAYIAAGGFTPNHANFYDLVMSMAAQIMKATKYMVDTAWVNPYDAMKMKLNKDANGVYTMPPFVVPSQNGPITVNGIKIIEANSVTAGTCVVGDSTKARLYSTGNVEIEVGYNLTGDFSKRILTILANMEASLLIRNAEVDAFLKSTDIANDIAGINEAGA